MNKFTNEQLVEIKNLNSADDLKVFLTKENITLTDEQMAKAISYFKSGKLELTDDNLEMVAGGNGKDDYMKEQAYAEGRTIPVNSRAGFCNCFVEQVWARQTVLDYKEKVVSDHGTYWTHYYIGTDVKCYSCGTHRDVYKYGEKQ